ncbi:MAG: hypothetical protein K2X81_10815, partial [Candidatus Obscuribacterales bacterium]|nr:hypothetical protein [Candidatus Obscuribacterales bacterium]
MIPSQILKTAINSTALLLLACNFELAPTALAETEKTAAGTEKTASKLPVSKAVSMKSLADYKTISVSIKEDNNKRTKYTGVPLRTLFAEMVPEIKIDTMPDWKALSRQELVMEVKGDDGYPGLVTAIELATNPEGDRFILATTCDGKPIEKGLQLICKTDEYHVR